MLGRVANRVVLLVIAAHISVVSRNDRNRKQRINRTSHIAFHPQEHCNNQQKQGPRTSKDTGRILNYSVGGAAQEANVVDSTRK